jgi:hypothetical protein
MQDGGEVLFLDGAGEVVVSIGRSGLSLQPLHPVRSGSLMLRLSACSVVTAEGYLQILRV